MILRNTHRLLQEIEALKQENLKLSSAVEKASALNTELIQKNASLGDECAELRSRLDTTRSELHMLRARVNYSNATSNTTYYEDHNVTGECLSSLETGTGAKKPCEFAWQMPYKIKETKK
jgi:FtsZ-binding cell division protein ZapB